MAFCQRNSPTSFNGWFALQELKGDVWSFNEKAFVFCNGDLVGGPTDFFKWAEQEFNYENFRPAPLYETLAEEAYKNFMNSKKVRARAK